MSECFTNRARKVMHLANTEAARFDHEFIGTEHLLLAIIKEGTGVAVNVLMNLNINLRQLHVDIRHLLMETSTPDMTDTSRLPMTPAACKVLRLAREEAQEFRHRYLGTEHLLLGLLRVREGVAARVLANLGLKINEVREEIANLLGWQDEDLADDPTIVFGN